MNPTSGEKIAQGLKVYISADMEGVAGVVGNEQLVSEGFEYEKFRENMTAEVNAPPRFSVVWLIPAIMLIAPVLAEDDALRNTFPHDNFIVREEVSVIKATANMVTAETTKTRAPIQL